MKKIIVIVVCILIGAFAGFLVGKLNNSTKEVPVETVETEAAPNIIWRHSHFILNEENVYNELMAQKVDFPEIVLAQAVLETGNFKSYNCRTRNNLFGLRKLNGEYMTFDHWTHSVAAYKKYIQKYNQLPKDYYQYLKDLGYAEDPEYTIKLKQIVH